MREKNKTKENNKMKDRYSVRGLIQGGAIAALYVALTFLAAQLGLSSGVIQLRLSEALCILPVFTPAAIPGLAIGCMLANALTGCIVLDVMVGSLATLIGALGTRALRNKPVLATFSPILANTIAVPFVLRYGYGMPDAIWYMAITVGVGEILSAGVLGIMLYRAIKKRSAQLFGQHE